MHKQVCVKLPVKDRAASKAFFAAVGYRFNANFSNDKGAAHAARPADMQSHCFLP